MQSEEHREHKYTGLLNQEEFKRRYAFIQARINSGYSQEDLAFLLGKPPYFVQDYEELNAGSKLVLEDLEILSVVITNLYPEILPFDLDECGENEKRILRGVCTETCGIRHYTFKHPWTMEGVNAKIMTVEKLPCVDDDEKEKMERDIYKCIVQLIDEGYFNNKCRPLFIFQQVSKRINNKRTLLKPTYFIPSMYRLIAANKLTMTSDRFRFSYQIFRGGAKLNKEKFPYSATN